MYYYQFSEPVRHSSSNKLCCLYNLLSHTEFAQPERHTHHWLGGELWGSCLLGFVNSIPDGDQLMRPTHLSVLQEENRAEKTQAQWLNNKDHVTMNILFIVVVTCLCLYKQQSLLLELCLTGSLN